MKLTACVIMPPPKPKESLWKWFGPKPKWLQVRTRTYKKRASAHFDPTDV